MFLSEGKVPLFVPIPSRGKMTSFKSHALSCDVLVIGGGGAALRAAIASRETGADVLVVSKTRVGFGNNTYLSKASWAAPGLGDPEDSYRVHVRDTLRRRLLPER